MTRDTNPDGGRLRDGVPRPESAPTLRLTLPDLLPFPAPATSAVRGPARQGVRLVGFVTAGPGGVMTDEVGAITGELALATERLGDGTAAVSVQYAGAWEWYTLTGSPVPVPEAGLARLHEELLDAVAEGDATVPLRH
ncbi:hypothetical protein [Streptomyces sp. NPDC097619]|uniref:hypothetical protein n=1 Tax=Streptomyces sp. NPDC097619 TaxID=3157228 RepID=UPI0033314526